MRTDDLAPDSIRLLLIYIDLIPDNFPRPNFHEASKNDVMFIYLLLADEDLILFGTRDDLIYI